MNMKVLGFVDQYHVPRECKICGGVMIFKGVGEYHCEKCNAVDYDDYGKARLYLEGHPGATAAQIEEHMGVSQKTIRLMLKDGRLEIAEDSKSFLRCEICGKNIRSGQFCPECEKNVHKKIEEQEREKQQKAKGLGIGMSKTGDEGHRRFIGKDTF